MPFQYLALREVVTLIMQEEVYMLEIPNCELKMLSLSQEKNNRIKVCFAEGKKKIYLV